jgi:hypothetical protein
MLIKSAFFAELDLYGKQDSDRGERVKKIKWKRKEYY